MVEQVNENSNNNPYAETNLNQNQQQQNEVNDVKESLGSMTAPTAERQKEEFPLAETFESLNLPEEILKGVYAMGFENPSKVQKHAIFPHMAGKDVIIQSQSGTGKTLAFVLGAIMTVDTKIRSPQVLVLCHTRELCIQTGNYFKEILKFSDQYKHHELYGGGPKIGLPDRAVLSQGVHIVVGTTGKIEHMMKNGALQTHNVKSVILDEADKMLDETNLRDVIQICQNLQNRSQLQVCLYSATIPDHVLDKIKEIMREDYYELLLQRTQVTLEGIKHYSLLCPTPEFKIDVLLSLINDLNLQTTVIFTNTRESVMKLGQVFDNEQIPYVAIHGQMEQQQRLEAVHAFKSGQKRFLLATDLVGRGMDVQQVSLVINHDIPNSRDDYMHRVGRSGRYGRKGVAINLVSEQEKRHLDSFEEHYNFTVAPLPAEVNTLFD